jgi:hypothetical protein
MVTNIRESKTTLELATNAGTRTTKKIANVPGYSTVLYDKTAIANIFGLSKLKKKHRVIHMTLRRKTTSYSPHEQ